MNRRQFIRFGVSCGISLTAGCFAFENNEYATLQSLDVINSTNESVTAELRIERNDTDEIVHEDMYELSKNPDMNTIDCIWPDASLTVMVRRVDGEWNTLTTSDYEDCLGVIAEIHEQTPSFLIHNGECSIASADCHTNAEE